MKILITGGNGQLATVFKDAITGGGIPKGGHDFVFLGKKDFDITDLTDPYKIKTYLTLNNFDFIINTAAYTNVDGAETSKELAELVNHTGVRNLARAVKGTDTRIIHISTDYVFPGKSYRPYVENDETGPLSYYGTTKLRGEEAILEGTKDSIIIRTGWLYSWAGINFVRKILTLAKKKSDEKSEGPLKIIADQLGAPTSADDLCYFILNQMLKGQFKNTTPEIYHFTNTGVASWYDLAVVAVDLCNDMQIPRSSSQINCKIVPTTTANYPTDAVRPFYSVLSLEKIQREFGVIPQHWTKALAGVMQFEQKALLLP